jgi:hypothetical protein
VLTKHRDAAQRDGTACELQVMLGNESQQMQNNQKKEKKTYMSCAGAWADAGGACGNTAEGVGGRPVSDNLEKSISKGKKKQCKEKKKHTVPGRRCRSGGADKQ